MLALPSGINNLIFILICVTRSWVWEAPYPVQPSSAAHMPSIDCTMAQAWTLQEANMASVCTFGCTGALGEQAGAAPA